MKDSLSPAAQAMEKIINGTPVADDGAQPARFDKRKDNGKNLGQFLHKSKTIPAARANNTIDANVGNKNVKVTQ